MDTASTPPITWHVVSQQETQQAGANGTYTQGVLVSFLLSTGDVGSVFVPRATFNVDTVRAAVEAQAAHMAAVAGLSTD